MLIKSINVFKNDDNSYTLKTEYNDGKIEEIVYINYEDAMNDLLAKCNTIKGGELHE